MAGTVDFNAIMGTKSKDVVPPRPLPQGTYFVKVGIPKLREVDSKDSASMGIIEFPLIVLSADHDVDTTELASYEEKGKIAGSRLKQTFWIKDAEGNIVLHHLKKWLIDVCKVEDNEDAELKEMIAGSNGAIIRAHVTWRFDKNDNTKIHNDVDQTLPEA